MSVALLSGRRRIPVSRVLSSPWCRCLETARLAFGQAEAAQPLSNLFGRSENRAAQLPGIKALIRQTPDNANLVLVTHGSTILALTGISPGTGELVIGGGLDRVPSYGQRGNPPVTGEVLYLNPAAREVLGYEPAVDLAEGLRRTLSWYEHYYRQNG